MVPALLDVSLTVGQGELVAIVGRSGCGKSTLMNILGLLDRPSSGQLKLGGEAIDLSMSDAHLAKLRGRRIGFVFQSFQLLPRLSALANVLLPTSYQPSSKASAKEKGIRLLESVGLGDRLDHRPTELSGGEKQRVAIARALINDPEIILADEPTGNLDSASGQQIIDLLTMLNRNGKTVIIITHDQEIANHCRRVISLQDGRIISDRQRKGRR